LGPGSRDPYRWVIPGLFEWYTPAGIAFWNADTSVIPLYAAGDLAGKPSLLVFMPRSGGIRKILELYVDDDTPFAGSVGGVAVTPDYLWTVDDSGEPAARKTSLVGFSRADINAALARGVRPERLKVTTINGKRAVLNAGVTASGVYFDPASGNPRLWVHEYWAPGKPGVPELRVASGAASSYSGEKGVAVAISCNREGAPLAMYQNGFSTSTALSADETVYIGAHAKGFVPDYEELRGGMKYFILTRFAWQQGAFGRTSRAAVGFAAPAPSAAHPRLRLARLLPRPQASSRAWSSTKRRCSAVARGT